MDWYGVQLNTSSSPSNFTDRLPADAICINQEDIHERAAQVQFMARIFASALHVTVWLGDHADGSAELFETLRNLTEEVSQHDIEKPPSSLGRRDQIEPSLRKLLKRPWFSRVWVILGRHYSRTGAI